MSLMPIKKTYWYSTSDSHGVRYEIQGSMHNLRDVASDAAEDYYGNHYGWESTWPIDFVIHETEDGPPVARFEVELDVEPRFYTHTRPFIVAGFQCPDCGHQHGGDDVAFICIGCPCERTALPQSVDAVARKGEAL